MGTLNNGVEPIRRPVAGYLKVHAGTFALMEIF